MPERLLVKFLYFLDAMSSNQMLACPFPRVDMKAGIAPSGDSARGLIVKGGIVGKLLEAGSIGMHPVDVGLTRTLGSKSDPVSVERQRWRVVAFAVRDQAAFVLAVGISNE